MISSRSAIVGGDEGVMDGEEKDERGVSSEAGMPRRRHAPRHLGLCTRLRTGFNRTNRHRAW